MNSQNINEKDIFQYYNLYVVPQKKKKHTEKNLMVYIMQPFNYKYIINIQH